MAKFRFKFEPLLAHRRRTEEQCERALAKLLREKLILETQLHNQQASISSDKHQLGEALTGRVDVDAIRRHAAHTNRLAIGAQQIAFRLFELTRLIESARHELLEARKQRRAIELLRDKRLAQWKRQIERRENAETDDLATNAYARRDESGVAA